MLDLDLAEDVAVRFRLRDYQSAALAAIDDGWKTYSRQLIDMATGTGKSSIMGICAQRMWQQQRGRTLILENRDALVKMGAKRAADETGLHVEIEMAGERASPFAQIVVASVPTISRDARLTGFADDHFAQIVVDESHHSVSQTYLKTLSYFHYGAESLNEGWVAPQDGTYKPRCRILGVTATPELSGNRTLGEIYQHIAFRYQLNDAVRDGWLVPPVAIMEPLKIDLRGLRSARTPHGSDYNATDVAERMSPIIDLLAEQFVRLASDRKTMAFMPSVRTAEMLAHAIAARGLPSIFVSGECLDRDDKTERFVRHGPGMVLCTAALYTEGFDVPDVDCVFAGITKSRGYYRQKIGRATRALKGTVDGLETPEERRAAIAASRKPNFLILDPFCKTDDIDLCDAYDLFTDKPEVKAKMKEMGPPGAATAEVAERDFLKSLEKEARKHARKAARVIDPLAWGLQIGDNAIAHYVPATPADARPVTDSQLAFLQRHQIDATNIKCSGLANKIIGRFLKRHELHLATPSQLSLMHKLGLDETTCAQLTQSQAGAMIGRVLEEKRRGR